MNSNLMLELGKDRIFLQLACQPRTWSDIVDDRLLVTLQITVPYIIQQNPIL